MRTASTLIEKALDPATDQRDVLPVVDRAREMMTSVSERFGGLLAAWRATDDQHAAAADQVLAAMESFDRAIRQVRGQPQPVGSDDAP
jgi:hypothetical protein